MIYFIVARKDNDTFNTYLKASTENIDCYLVEVLGEESIFHKYNKGVSDCIQSGLKDEDIVIFTHEDVRILDHFFQEKMEKVFKEKLDVGLVGVIGTKRFPELGGWWMQPQEQLAGSIIQETEKTETHMIKGMVGYAEDIVAIDGLMFAVRGKALKDGIRFDETFDSKFDFYDITFCIDFLLNTNYKIAIANILVQHRSPGLGALTEGWKSARKNLVKRYKDLGLTFPISAESIKKFKEIK